MSNYTKGPWKITRRGGDSAHSIQTQVCISRHIANSILYDELPIAVLMADEREGINPEANARLIAAAPDMLAALKNLLDNHLANRSAFSLALGHVPNPAAALYIEQMDSWMGDVERAIAKARSDF